MIDNFYKDMEQLSGKYRYLKQAEKSGILTPKTLLVAPKITASSAQEIENFVALTGAKRFIIRSMNACEDGETNSYAGHFWSSEAILADDIFATITKAYQKNEEVIRELKLKITPRLMLQEFIEHSIGGVLFSPWSFFTDYYYVEYSTESVQQVVSGNAKPAVLSLNKDVKAPLELDHNLSFLEDKLIITVKALKKQFCFPIDCEWVYATEQDKIIVLQIRPQTSLVGALKPASKEAINKVGLSNNWKFGALSESLGSISLLSFSLLEQLYTDSMGAFQSLGYKASQVDFLKQLPDGTVLVDPARENLFFQPTLLGGFWKAFKAPTWQKNANDYRQKSLNNNYSEQLFSYKTLSKLFQFWMVANILSDGAGREKLMQAHAYELSWLQNIKAPKVVKQKSEIQDWEILNTLYRDAFFYELNKLKIQLQQSSISQIGFCQWEEYLANDFTHANKRQQEDSHHAIFDFSNANEGSNLELGFQSIGAKKCVSGELFIIENPASFHQTIPKGSIVLAPYFDNRWVHTIKNIEGIITHKGSRLSHSAIIAREYGVPFCIISDESIKGFKQGNFISLDSIQQKIEAI
jgi:phosphohistidine swiveling domain-containing protein